MSNLIDTEPTSTAITPANGNHPPRGIIETMAARYNMDTARFKQTLIKTVIKGHCTDEQFAAFLLVAKQYDLNPFTKEIFAFPAKEGGIQPIVSIDGWLKMTNSHPHFDGMAFEDHLDGDKLTAITCTIYRKDRTHPICVTEYMAECARNTDVWKRYPARMLRHKATIQAARYAFGFSGLLEPDEYERMQEAEIVSQNATNEPTITDEQRDELAILLDEGEVDIVGFCRFFKIAALNALPASQYEAAKAAIERSIAQRRRAKTQTQTQTYADAETLEEKVAEVQDV